MKEEGGEIEIQIARLDPFFTIQDLTPFLLFLLFLRAIQGDNL